MKNILKGNKGSITLFVLVSMLFMTMFLVTIYTLSTNNEIGMRNATQKLKEKYEIGIDRIDEIYEELKNPKAYDQYGNEIEDFSDNWGYQNFNNIGWGIKYKGTINEEGKLTGEIPYYIRVGNKEKYVVSYANMFENINKDNITTLDVSNFKTDKIVSMRYMFLGFTNVQTLDITNFNTDNVTQMGGVFENCKNLEELYWNEFNTSKVTEMWYMFSNCTRLSELDLSGFDTSNVTSVSNMFANCTNLRKLDISGFDTSNITTMANMFSGCTNLGWIDINGNGSVDESDERPILDLSNFNTTKVTNVSNMFRNCTKLNQLELGENFDISASLENISGCFNKWTEGKIVNVYNKNTYEILTDPNNTSAIGVSNTNIFVNKSE